MTKLGMPPDIVLIEKAVEWMTRLTSGLATDKDQKAFAIWRQESPANAIAWERLQSAVNSSFAGCPSQVDTQAAKALRIALTQPSNISLNRRRLLKSCVTFVAVTACGYTAVEFLRADFSTKLAECETFNLPDGSELVLNARSAVNVHFSNDARIIELKSGELVVTVARDAHRPLIVRTPQGEIRALGTKFLVKREQHQTLVAVLEHSVLLTGTDGSQKSIQQGQVATLRRSEINMRDDSAEAHAAWLQGLIDVRNAPLGEVIDALRSYHGGWVRISSEAARLPVFGVFPLSKTKDALQALAETMPIQLRHFGTLLTLIDVKPKSK